MSDTKKVMVSLTAHAHKYFDAVIEIPTDTSREEMEDIYYGLFRDAQFSDGEWKDGDSWVDDPDPKSDPSMKFTRVDGKMKVV